MPETATPTPSSSAAAGACFSVAFTASAVAATTSSGAVDVRLAVFGDEVATQIHEHGVDLLG